MDVIAALVRGVGAEEMIEFGCRDGRTARVLLHNVPSLTHYIGIDVPVSYRPGLAMQKSEMVAFPGRCVERDPRFELMIRANGTLDLRPEELPRCDAIFIDGDHSKSAVAHDSRLAMDVIRPGGVVIWHDYNNHHTIGVKHVLDELADQGEPICLVKNTWLAFRRA